MTSLWGELPAVPVITTPAKILNEQAAALQESTSGVIVGSVVQVTPKYIGGGVAYELRAVVPSLNNYTIRILVVEHGVLSYPCRATSLRSVGSGGQLNLADEAQFIEFLTACLSDSDLMGLFSNLIAQVRAAAE